MTRRRSWFHEDILAPWLTLLVILVLWWAGASLVGSTTTASTAAPAPIVPPMAADRVKPVAPPPQPREGAVPDAPDPHPVLTSPSSGAHSAAGATLVAGAGAGDISELHARGLTIPVQGFERSHIVSNFDQNRGGGRKHEALDIMSPRGTPVLAAEDGRIARLFASARGGLTIYQFDPSERFCYYYAHLDHYAPNLKEGQGVRRGDDIGFVGTTGNAPPNAPHLHFAISRLGPDKKWWGGDPLDPALVLK
jgi:murein DD-endopeptidase MepM/ murein hydrolase activator NlpD